MIADVVGVDGQIVAQVSLHAEVPGHYSRRPDVLRKQIREDDRRRRALRDLATDFPAASSLSGLVRSRKVLKRRLKRRIAPRVLNEVAVDAIAEILRSRRGPTSSRS